MKKKRILIVEDEPITAMEEEEFMYELGYEVTGIAFSGESAIQQAGDDRPDVILMDITLQGKIDGSKAALEIYSLYHIPVVFVTAHGKKWKALSENLSIPEGFGYVVKPYSRDELQNEIKRVSP